MRSGFLVVPVLLVLGGVAMAEGVNVVEADARFKEGQELFAHGKYAEAEVKFVEACAAHRTSQCPKNLALAELRLDRHADAATHLREYFQTPEGMKDPELPQLRQLATQEQLKVGELKIKARDGAVVTVDGKPAGKAPLAATVFVEPGSHKIVATYGTETEERTATVSARGMLDVDASPKSAPIGSASASASSAPSASSSVPPMPSGSAAPPPSNTPKIIAGATLAGVGVVGLVLGGVFAGVSNGARSDGDAYANTHVCAGASDPRCDELQTIIDRQRSFHAGSISAFVGGAIFAVAGAALLIWGATSGRSVSVGGQGGAGGARLLLEGTF